MRSRCERWRATRPLIEKLRALGNDGHGDGGELDSRSCSSPVCALSSAPHAGHGLRRATRQPLTARGPTRRDTRQLLELLARMIAFTEAVARLRETQHRAARAAAARRAAEQLQHCRHVYAGPPPGD